MRVFVMRSVLGLHETAVNNGVNCSADNEPHSGECVCPDTENADKLPFQECEIKLHNNPCNTIPMVKAKPLVTITAHGCVPQPLNYSITEKDPERPAAKGHL